ncbi:MAG: dihydropteroate synthase [Chitinophagaceae bacterium]|nr:MAG: dihydropteroate synthase [Chitinophagaceae bacterium]
MFTLNCKGRLLVYDRPVVMGILNVTPDSFYEGSRFGGISVLLEQAGRMLAEGAAMIDIGGQSTRPGSTRIDAAEETARVVSAIESLHFNFPELVISIDTYDAGVAVAAVRAGASVVNDISGGLMDPEMISTVAGLGVPYICTHMQGRPETMHLAPDYDDVCKTVMDFFIERMAHCKKAGIRDIILDPGFGFGKTIAHNFLILQNLDLFNLLDRPLLLGVSRKGSIYRTLGVTAAEALNGTTVLNTIGLMKGASILRVHDVKEAVEAVKLVAHL